MAALLRFGKEFLIRSGDAQLKLPLAEAHSEVIAKQPAEMPRATTPKLRQLLLRLFLRDNRGALCLCFGMSSRNAKPDPCVAMLKALADERRWEMVRTLLAEELSVSQLGERLGMTQYNVSKHLRCLREAGIVVTERAGKEVRCAIAPAFRAELSRKKNRLDLGCCSFDFNVRR